MNHNTKILVLLMQRIVICLLLIVTGIFHQGINAIILVMILILTIVFEVYYEDK